MVRAAKELHFNKNMEALKKMQAGADKLATVVGVTLGPKVCSSSRYCRQHHQQSWCAVPPSCWRGALQQLVAVHRLVCNRPCITTFNVHHWCVLVRAASQQL